jgi:hypothetical protein
VISPNQCVYRAGHLLLDQTDNTWRRLAILSGLWLDLAEILTEVERVDPSAVSRATEMLNVAGSYLDEQVPESIAGFERATTLARCWLRVVRASNYPHSTPGVAREGNPEPDLSMSAREYYQRAAALGASIDEAGEALDQTRWTAFCSGGDRFEMALKAIRDAKDEAGFDPPDFWYLCPDHWAGYLRNPGDLSRWWVLSCQECDHGRARQVIPELKEES